MTVEKQPGGLIPNGAQNEILVFTTASITLTRDLEIERLSIEVLQLWTFDNRGLRLCLCHGVTYCIIDQVVEKTLS